MDWVKAEDALPKMNDVVVIYVQGVVSVGSYLGDFRSDPVWAYADSETAYGVTHWMPLPDPPKE